MPSPASWTIEKTIPTLAVPDLEMGIEYYERLGFQEDWRFPDGNPTHVGLVLGPCSIMLSRNEPAERADLYFIVDDVQACYATITEGEAWEIAEEAALTTGRAGSAPKRSLAAPQPPKPTDYGLIDFSMVDPWGHHLTFGQPKPQA